MAGDRRSLVFFNISLKLCKGFQKENKGSDRMSVIDCLPNSKPVLFMVGWERERDGKKGFSLSIPMLYQVDETF